MCGPPDAGPTTWKLHGHLRWSDDRPFRVVHRSVKNNDVTECTHCRKRYENEVRFCPVDGFAVVPVTENREPWVGRLLMGQFAIQAVCGQGATGTVYRASQAGMERQVAVKVLRADLLKDPDIVKRFIREARAGAKISHPNIATVHMVGQTEEGAPFIVMEYIDGRSLSALLDKGRPLPLAKIVQLSSQIAAALTEAHAQGIVHRDLKPENILISERRGQPDVVKLVDFGIAKILVAYAPGEDAISRMGTVFGTPHYIAPEQASGQAVDGRADLYSLGCIVFQMATGRVPFDGQAGLQVLLSQVRDPVIDPREVNPKISDDLAELILSLLEKDPAARPQTAKEVRAALLALAPPAGGSDKAARASEDHDLNEDEPDEGEDGDQDGPSLDAWASGPHDDAVPKERPRPTSGSAHRPASGAAGLPKSARRADPTPRSGPKSGRPSSAQRPRPSAPLEPAPSRRQREIIDDDVDSLVEPFYKRHAKSLLGVLAAITVGLLFGVLYAQLRTAPTAQPLPVQTPPAAPVATPPVSPNTRPGTNARPNTPTVRPIGPVKPAAAPTPTVPVSATAPTIPAATGPAIGAIPAPTPAVPPTVVPPAAANPAALAPVAVPAKPVEKAPEKAPEKTPEKAVETPTEKSPEKAPEKAVETPTEKSPETAEKAQKPEKTTEKSSEKPAEKPAEKPKDKPKENAPEDSAAESTSDPYGGLK